MMFWGYFGERLAVITLQRSLVDFCFSQDASASAQHWLTVTVLVLTQETHIPHTLHTCSFHPAHMNTHAYVLYKRGGRTAGVASTARSQVTLRSTKQQHRKHRELDQDHVEGGHSCLFRSDRCAEMVNRLESFRG